MSGGSSAAAITLAWPKREWIAVRDNRGAGVNDTEVGTRPWGIHHDSGVVRGGRAGASGARPIPLNARVWRDVTEWQRQRRARWLKNAASFAQGGVKYQHCKNYEAKTQIEYKPEEVGFEL